MNIKNLLIVFLSLIFIISCTEDTILLPDNSIVVVQAYLYVNEPVTEIRLSGTLAIDAETGTAPPINDAEVFLIKSDLSYGLVASAGDSGFYHYPDSDLYIRPGDEFELKIYYNDQNISARTVVPEPPMDLSITAETLEVVELIERGYGNFELIDSNAIELSWTNDNDQLFYVVIDNIDMNPTAIETQFNRLPRRYISQPINRDFYRINQLAVSHYGMHRVKLYRINQEYADLYQSREQDTRDLNEPLSNIENGLGVFSAFASDSLFFMVK